jgi:HlyD family secretion protein
MFRIVRDGLVELDAEVSETDLAKINAGSRATVALPSGAQVPGVVRMVSPRVDLQTKLGRARISLTPRADLRPGGFARATFGQAGRNVTAAPEAAIRYDADGASVMTVTPDNKVRRVNVRTGGRAGGWVELVEGPPVGSRVALGGSAFVLDGDTVKPVEAAAGPAR